MGLKRRLLQRVVGALLFLSANPAHADNPQALLHTSMGDIVIELFPEQAPVTVENFVQYARDGFYDGTIFHRVVPRFVIQGGGFTPEMQEKPTRDPIVNESEHTPRNARWTVAMARTPDPDSATSQFFINMRMNLNLDFQKRTPGYAVFGRVIEGQDVVRQINLVPTHTVGGMADVPVEPVVLHSVKIRDAVDTGSTP